MHIIDKRFPLIANNGYLPEEFNHQQYLKRMSSYDLCGGVIVSGSFQAFDQSYLTEALSNLGDSYVGVTQLPASVSDAEIQRLNNLGVRAVRFNLKRGGSESVAHLAAMAARIYELAGWHIELYIDSTELEGLHGTLINLPAVSIDHVGLSKSGFVALTHLAEKGVKVKATGFSRVNFDIKPALKDLYSANPSSLMFGSDLPSTRSPKPYSDNDFILVAETLGEEASINIFSENAIKFYNPKKTTNKALKMDTKSLTAFRSI